MLFLHPCLQGKEGLQLVFGPKWLHIWGFVRHKSEMIVGADGRLDHAVDFGTDMSPHCVNTLGPGLSGVHGRSSGGIVPTFRHELAHQ